MKQTEGEPDRWCYVRDGRRHGPVDVAQLVDLLLASDVPEDTLVWRPGLSDWRPAREVDEIQRELPPPVPVAPPSPSSAMHEEGEEDEDADDYEDEPETGEAGENRPSSEGERVSPAPADGSSPGAEGGEGHRRRTKKRKRRHRDSQPQWLVPLLLVLLFLMMGLWWLLRRMNEVPAGRIIQTGSLSAPRSGESPGSPRASLPPPRA